MEKMTLRGLCTTLGVSRRAVQGYEKAGLVSPSGKNDRGHLLYDAAAQERVKKIKQYQDFGFQVKEIKTLLTLPAPHLKEELEKKRDELRDKKHSLETTIRVMDDVIRSLEEKEV